MDRERYTRRRFLIATTAGLGAGSLASTASASPLDQVQNPDNSRSGNAGCLGPLALLGTIGGGFWIMTGGLRRRRDNTPITRREADQIRRRLDDMERRNR